MLIFQLYKAKKKCTMQKVSPKPNYTKETIKYCQNRQSVYSELFCLQFQPNSQDFIRVCTQKMKDLIIAEKSMKKNSQIGCISVILNERRRLWKVCFLAINQQQWASSQQSEMQSSSFKKKLSLDIPSLSSFAFRNKSLSSMISSGAEDADDGKGTNIFLSHGHLYYQSGEQIPIILAEGMIKLDNIVSHLGKQLKIVLLYDGIFVGSLYCKFAKNMDQDETRAKTFLYLHKIDIILLEDFDSIFSIDFAQNGCSIFRKEFHLHQRSKSLFPNLKIPVQMADVITVTFAHHSLQIRQVRFQMDTIKRGKTSFYQVWLRNKLKNKIGDLKLQYFMENLFLENERQVFTRTGIYKAGGFNNGIGLITLSEAEKERLRKSVIIRQIEEADKRILKINPHLQRLIKNIDVVERKSAFCQQPKITNSQLRG